jgi:hypothetical protein
MEPEVMFASVLKVVTEKAPEYMQIELINL